MKLFNFLVNLTSTESKRTILRAMINTLESNKLEEIVEGSQILGFFEAANKIFQLEYGKILLAISSSSQLEEMVDKGLPYLANYTEAARSCFNGSSCNGVRGVVDTLGKDT